MQRQITTMKELSYFLNNTKNVLQEKIVSGSDASYRFTFFNHLRECACSAQNYSRKKNNRRVDLESNIMNEVRQRFPLTKEASVVLNYLSLGSGGLLQDFIICGQLIQAGYSLNIALIESDDGQHFQEALIEFKSLEKIAKKVKLDLTVKHYKDIREYHADVIHIAHTIDFEFVSGKIDSGSLDHVLLTHKHLHPDGFLYFSYKNGDIIYDEQKGNVLMQIGCNLSRSSLMLIPVFNSREIRAITLDPAYEIINSFIKKTSHSFNPYHKEIDCAETILGYVGLFDFCKLTLESQINKSPADVASSRKKG